MYLASLAGLLRMFGNGLLVRQHEFKRSGSRGMTVKKDSRFCCQILYPDIAISNSRADVSREPRKSKQQLRVP